MKLLVNFLQTLLKPQKRQLMSFKYEYDMPEEYRNSFYLANATLDNSTNWFIHNALGVIYNDLIYEFLKTKKYNSTEAQKEISNVMSLLDVCNSCIEVQVPIKRHNGDVEVFTGYRAEHGRYVKDKPFLGGLRLCPDVEKSDVEALALLSSFKYACFGIDMLGAHSGIAVNPKNLNHNELRQLVSKYTKQLIDRNFCGTVNVFEPDLSCGKNEMEWMISTHSKILEKFGGVKNRETAIAHGIMCGLDKFLHKPDFVKFIGLEEGWKNKTFLLQGLGTVGASTAKYLSAMGVKCLGIIEQDCHIYDLEGIDVLKAINYKNTYGTLNGFLEKTKITPGTDSLVKPCDILVLAAMQRTLPYYIADKIQARIVIEAANGAIPPSVHKILLLHKKLVLPDVLINAGSSIVSYLEYLKNLDTLSISGTDTVYQDLIKRGKVSVQKPIQEAKFFTPTLRWHHLASSVDDFQFREVVESMMLQTIEELTKTIILYKLKLDIRCAAYIKALNKLFWITYKNNFS
ncbi:hypothetical protein RN001_004362 [Aquatica leii]|uniref:Glutamate dehydrogenase n=1 Tax=Aquatica leii TaxID=1421715 RepID=A0AAN7QJI0_9COLE|nr:hypothetical protein RN001_004362 [Aquatica leii]